MDFILFDPLCGSSTQAAARASSIQAAELASSLQAAYCATRLQSVLVQATREPSKVLAVHGWNDHRCSLRVPSLSLYLARLSQSPSHIKDGSIEFSYCS